MADSRHNKEREETGDGDGDGEKVLSNMYKLKLRYT